jgi:hypothetical protein
MARKTCADSPSNICVKALKPAESDTPAEIILAMSQ